MLLREMLLYAAEREPGREAIVSAGRRYTYEAWYERVRRLAGGLWKLGVRPGDRVLQVLRNREENCAIHWACQLIGAVNTPVNFRWKAGELAFCVADSEPAVLVYEEASRAAVSGVRAQWGDRLRLVYVGEGAEKGVVGFEELVEGGREGPPRVELDEGSTSLMLYTSGTTGRPKGVPRSQRAEYAATVGQIIHHGLERGERTLGVMPLYHTMGVHTLTSMVAMNGTFVVMEEWDAGAALGLIERERLTYLYLVPTLYHMLVNHDDFARRDVSSVRKLAYAGAPMLAPLVKRCNEAFRPQLFVNHYGSTEVYIHSVYGDAGKKPGCAGKSALHTGIRVVRAEPGASVKPDEEVKRGEVGEIIVRLGDDGFRGYHRRPEATARAIREGWYFTGDTGYLDEEGDLWVVGRVDDMIITGGENVHPVEVEEVLAEHPKVAEVAVVGLPDEVWGQVVAAFVVARDPTLSAEELDRWCVESERLSRFKRPRRYVFVQEIPKSGTGKILRRVLAEGQYEEARRGE